MWLDAERGADAPPETPPARAPEGKPEAKPDKPGGGGEGKDKAAPERVKELELALERERKRAAELESSERYWAERARRGKAETGEDADPDEPGEPEGGEEDEDAPPDKVLEEFSAEGMKALRKRGLVTRKEALRMAEEAAERVSRKVVGAETKKLTRDAQLIAQYPDLNDEKSELFGRTREIYLEMVEADPGLKKSPAALMLAARTAKAELAKADKAAGEEERLERVRRQAGDTGRRGVGFERDEDTDELSEGQRRILDRFNADGGVMVSEEAYRKRAKTGVRMSAKNGYQTGSFNWG